MNYYHILVLFAFVFHIFVTNITAHRILSNKTCHTQPLYDIIHHHTDNLSEYKHIIDILAFIFLLPLMLCDGNCKSDFIYVSAIVVILRSITILVNDLPKSDNNCYQNMTIYNYVFGHCYDKVFSGHVALTLIGLLLIHKYNIFNEYVILLLCVLHLFYSFLIILTRGHYTMDVLLSYYIVIPMFYYLKS
jgi:hypothetical protein